ncbi:hypothetical protein D3C74_313820 [compost metagenome]
MLTNGLVILRNLISFRRIRIEIVLTVKLADITDFTIQRHCGFHRIIYRLAVQYRQYSGMSKTHRTSMAIRGSTKFSRAAAENFGLRMQLNVHFQPDHCFIFGC